jgi:hypothetical protein
VFIYLFVDLKVKKAHTLRNKSGEKNYKEILSSWKKNKTKEKRRETKSQKNSIQLK